MAPITIDYVKTCLFILFGMHTCLFQIYRNPFAKAGLILLKLGLLSYSFETPPETMNFMTSELGRSR